MKRVNSLVWGTVLLLLGIVLVLNQLQIIDVGSGMIFPILLLALALLFHLYYFFSGRGNEGLLVPGGILLVYGLMFLLGDLNSEQSNIFYNGLWPLWILGPALGLFELYVFSRGTKGSMIPVFILTAIGGGFLLNTFLGVPFSVVLAIVLIGVGVSLMVNSMGRNDHWHEHHRQMPAPQAEQTPPPPQPDPQPQSQPDNDTNNSHYDK